MKPSFLFLTLPLAGMLACIPYVKVGETQTITVNAPLPASGVADVSFRVAQGTFNLTGGSSRLAEGTIKFNVATWAPNVTQGAGTLSINQSDETGGAVVGSDVVNTWDLKLGNSPMDLKLSGGGYKCTLDLSGLRLRNLVVEDGATDCHIAFNSVAPQPMEALTYKTGASTVEFTGLANANFGTMSFVGGVGTYTFDFSGTLQRDTTVSLQPGNSSATVVIPTGLKATVNVTGTIGSVDTTGSWGKTSNTYTTSGAGSALTININSNTTRLKLVQQ